MAIKLLVLDHDGVLTDNYVYTDQDGRETCRYWRGDGIGIAKVKARGINVLILSNEVDGIVQARAKKLGVQCLAVVTDKLRALRTFCDWHSVDLEDVAYLGNDENDLACLQSVGYPAIVQDAEYALRVLRSTCKFHVTLRNGGQGAVRDFCESIADGLFDRPYGLVFERQRNG